jgi:hypothetical protein
LIRAQKAQRALCGCCFECNQQKKKRTAANCQRAGSRAAKLSADRLPPSNPFLCGSRGSFLLNNQTTEHTKSKTDAPSHPLDPSRFQISSHWRVDTALRTPSKNNMKPLDIVSFEIPAVAGATMEMWMKFKTYHLISLYAYPQNAPSRTLRCNGHGLFNSFNHIHWLVCQIMATASGSGRRVECFIKGKHYADASRCIHMFKASSSQHIPSRLVLLQPLR